MFHFVASADRGHQIQKDTYCQYRSSNSPGKPKVDSERRRIEDDLTGNHTNHRHTVDQGQDKVDIPPSRRK